MPKKRLDTEEAFKSIMGIHDNATPRIEDTAKPVLTPEVKEPEKDSLIHRTYYITKKQYRALKIKAAISNNPQEKDLSAIVRAALDAYLVDELKNL